MKKFKALLTALGLALSAAKLAKEIHDFWSARKPNKENLRVDRDSDLYATPHDLTRHPRA